MSKAFPHQFHKYYKMLLGKKIVYKCAVPDCAHYVLRELVLNRISICWNCNKPFTLPKAISLLTSKPWCPECQKTRKVKKEITIPTDVMSRIMENF